MKLIYNSIFLEHETGHHPENKNRLVHFFGTKETKIPNGEKFLELAHTKNHINMVKEFCQSENALDIDTVVSKKSYEVACYAVGAAIKASEELAFSLGRPPGHHASPNKSSGFCIFNNIAIAAKKLMQEGKKVFIFDFDLHHGNGTQQILSGEKNAFYFSLHQSPLYPGTGLESKENYINIPLPYGIKDAEYISFLDEKLIPAIEKFNPDIVGVSAGFDCHYKDMDFLGPGAGFELSEKTFLRIREILRKCKTFYVLEGGYNPESVKEGVEIFIK